MIRRVRLLAATTAMSLTIAGCGGGTDAGNPSSGSANPRASTAPSTDTAASASASQQPPESAVPAAECPAATGDDAATCQIVLATANIFGAGHDEPPAPGEGGAGTLPPMWEVPPGAMTMAVTDTAGTVKPVPAAGGTGASGEAGWVTDISSYNGISGIVHRKKGLFLVGVFITDEIPVDGEHPDRLGFTDNEDFAELAPEIGQTFFIGNGVGHTYVIPSGATRLFLGFADANQFQGDPGYYGNNSGQLTVTVKFAGD